MLADWGKFFTCCLGENFALVPEKINRDGRHLFPPSAILIFLNLLKPEKAAGYDYKCIEFIVTTGKKMKPSKRALIFLFTRE